jgi:TRAP-type C4-dicarboxylate transport system permease small subunit
MDKKTTGIIATVVTALLCGCCALFACIMGFGTITGNGTFNLGDTVQPMPSSYGYVFLCLSVLFIAVPIVVGFVTLRKKPEEVVPISDEPLPPAS